MPLAERRPAFLALLSLYPAYWIAMVLVNALPALAVALISRSEIAELRADWTGLVISTAVRGLGRGYPDADLRNWLRLAVEGFLRTPGTPPGASFGPNELLKFFTDLNVRILHYEDAEGKPDFGPPRRVVRLCAQKPEPLQ